MGSNVACGIAHMDQTVSPGGLAVFSSVSNWIKI